MKFIQQNLMSIQDYQLISKLGSGSFGVVHKAREKKTNNIVVVKIVDISNMNTKLRKSAIDQGRILKQMNSPYVVKHYNTFITKTNLYIVIQYCPKGDLAAYMKSQMGKPLKQQTIWKISIQMMVGLRDLHAKKILHRDIKTLNVFLDENYNVRIGDLGVAKTMNSDFAHTIVGTPYYLSPQMCEQKPYNEKTDIWAMGCIIYELCAGKRPFQATNQAALALKIVMGKFQNIPSQYSSDLSWIVKSCLSLDYKRRPTASYLLAMPKTKEWADKLYITIDSSKPQRGQHKQAKVQQIQQKKLLEEPLKIKKVSPQIKKAKQSVQSIRKVVKQNAKQTPKPKDKSKEKSKQKQKEKPPISIKLTKQGQKNVKEVLVNKVPNDAKQKKFSGAKRFQMKNQIQQKQQPSKLKPQIKLPPKPKVQQKSNKNIDAKGYASQMPSKKTSVSEKQKIMNTTANKFLPQNFKKLKQIDYEDEVNIQQVEIPDSDNSSDKQQIIKQQQKSNKAQLIHGVQQVVDDDQLAKQFGIVKKQPEKPKKQQKKQPKKQQKISHFHLDKKPLSINWNQLGNESDIIKKNKSIRSEQIPTVKSHSNEQNQKLKQMKINQQQAEDMIDQQINQNRPYISDEQQQAQKQQEEQQLLIQDFDQKQQDLVQKMKQNQKRKNELQRMKKLLQPQLLKLMPKNEYQQLKLKLIQCKQEEVEQFVASWKNNIKCINLFYRIIHFDIQIKRCQSNLNQIHARIEEIKKQKL